MGLRGLWILLDNAGEVFFPGQTLTGTFNVSIKDEPEEFKGISIECKGEAEVRYSSGDDSYWDTENYFKFTIPFVVPPAGGKFELAVGEHKYPFSFTLPFKIPSSFENFYGHVRYTLLGTCERPQALKLNYRCLITFNVNSIVDLNLVPDARMPTSSTNSTMLGCCCCKSGPITAKAWINQIGHAPGQVVYFSAEVENLSGKRLNGTRVQLLQCSTFMVRSSITTQTSSQTILEKYHGPFDKSDIWTNEPIVIPGLAPSTLPHCSIIDIEYRIQFVVETGLFKFDLRCPMALLIGNVPVLANNSQQGELHQPPLSRPDTNFLFEARPTRPSKLQTSDSVDYPDLPPPRYEECFLSRGLVPNVNAESSDQQQLNSNEEAIKFTPRYITYAPLTAAHPISPS